jgi:hypothetical protein
LSKEDILVNISKKYYKEVKRRLMIAEEDRQYGRYKKYGGKIKFEKYLSRLYGMNEVCEALMEVLEDE